MTRHQRQRAKVASERGRKMARRRWDLDAERRRRLADHIENAPTPGPTLRVVVIRNESTVKEAVVWPWDSEREAKRKIREAMMV